jgi:uncharacterized protein (DUF58 family)
MKKIHWNRKGGGQSPLSKDREPRKLSFTREGQIAVVLAVVIGVAAINTGNNLLYLLLGWLLAFIIASGILSEMTMRGLRITRAMPATVIAGEPFLLELTVENLKLNRASYSIEIEDLVGDVPVDKRCYFLKIPAGKQQRTTYRHTFPRRGLHRIDRARIATKFPFSLFRKSREINAVTEVVVLPPRIAVRPPVFSSQVRGDTQSQRLGRRGEFFGLREHRLGDDRRDVHWRSSARTGRLLVREFEDESSRAIVIVLDNGLRDEVRSADADNMLMPQQQDQMFAFDRAVATAHSLAAMYIEQNWSVELVARGCHIRPGQGRMHFANIGRALATLQAAAIDTPFAASVALRSESVLIVPRGADNHHRPATGAVIEA